MSVPLLKTKFYFPAPQPQIVPRNRLIKQLNSQFFQSGTFLRRLTLIAAPPGYGKTTLAAEWLRHFDALVAWLSLEESDNDPTRFLTYFISAIQLHIEGFGQSVLSMLQLPQSPETEIILTLLINEIETLQQAVVVCLDDYHTIQSAAIHHQVAFILDHQPSNLHLVIATRADPLLPIGRLRARNQILEIRQQDLRFQTDETKRFVNELLQLSLSLEDINILERRTEGWIAGLQLAALSLRGRSEKNQFIKEFSGTNQFILDYLIGEVLSGQSEDVKEFLVKTSILDRMTASLCDALILPDAGESQESPTPTLESSRSASTLAYLERANLFIVALDQSRTWYRYHHLFAELLRHHLRRTEGERLSLYHERASMWYRKEGFTPQAIQHALLAKQWEQAAVLIQEISTQLLRRGEVVTLIHWFQEFPREVLLSNPRLCYGYCWPLLLTGQYGTAAPLLEHVEEFAQNIPAFLGEIHAAQAYLARGTGDHARMVEKSEKALALLPKSAADSRGLVALNLGLAYWHMGNMAAAQKNLAEALETGQTTRNHYMYFTAMVFQGRILSVKGQLTQAAEIFRRAIAQGGQIPINALSHLDLATIHYELDDLEKSQSQLDKAVQICRRTKNDEFLLASLMMQTRLELAQENISEAEKSLEEAGLLIRSGKIPGPTAARLDSIRALYETAVHGNRVAPAWADTLNENVDAHNFYRYFGLTKARMLVVSNQFADARELLARFYELASQNGWGYAQIVVRVWQACAERAPYRKLEYLAEALKLAEPENYVRTFVEAGKSLIDPLTEALRQGIATTLAGNILSVLASNNAQKPTQAKPPVEMLSEREIEVLRLIAAGFSNRKIGETLSITAGTAKTHVHNICGKLAVQNRTEAAILAKDLGII